MPLYCNLHHRAEFLPLRCNPPILEKCIMSMTGITLYGTPRSGHCHRVELLLRMLGLPYRYVEAPAPVRATPEFRRLNRLGQIPVLVDGDLVLADSNAILVYLVRRYAGGSNWLPDAPVAAARVQRWLSIAAGELKYGPATARVAVLWGEGRADATSLASADRLLHFMEDELGAFAYLVADHPT